MLTKTAAISILAFTAGVRALAMPQPTQMARGEPAVVGEEDIIDPATYPIAIGGAIDIANKFAHLNPSAPEATAAPSLAERQDDKAILARAPAAVTFRITNKFGADISTRHARNANAPAPISGNVGAGVLKNGAVGSFAVPTGWAGNVALVQNGGRAIVGDESLIEGSFVKQGGTDAIIDIDVSYVTGFSVPVVCGCAGSMVTGCNKNLWGLNKCPNDNGVGSCKNPLRADGNIKNPTAFFAPCRGGAYTFPADHAANANGICKGAIIDCCIGTGCAKNPKQPA